jgi:ABC-type polysaccharide/polyol phosphate export permease
VKPPGIAAPLATGSRAPGEILRRLGTVLAAGSDFHEGLAPEYDSAAPDRPIVDQLRQVWQQRELLRILAARDAILRYKRSILGVWWTLLNPLLRMAVMWAVLSGIFHVRPVGVPYIVYLLSGVIVVTFFEQAVMMAGSSIVNSSGVLSKVYVPPQLFALSAVLAALVTMLASLLVLLVILFATGVGVRWTAVFVPVPLLALVVLATGCGLLLASVAVRINDALDFTVVLLQLAVFVTPTFYLLSSVSWPARGMIEANPLSQILALLRDLLYGGTFSAWWTWAWALGAPVLALSGGVLVLARSWKTSAAML